MKLCGVLSKSVWRGYRIQQMASAARTSRKYLRLKGAYDGMIQKLEILNKQINKEFYSAYLYLTFADFFEDKGLKGFTSGMYSVSGKGGARRILRRYHLITIGCPRWRQ